MALNIREVFVRFTIDDEITDALEALDLVASETEKTLQDLDLSVSSLSDSLTELTQQLDSLPSTIDLSIDTNIEDILTQTNTLVELLEGGDLLGLTISRFEAVIEELKGLAETFTGEEILDPTVPEQRPPIVVPVEIDDVSLQETLDTITSLEPTITAQLDDSNISLDRSIEPIIDEDISLDIPSIEEQEVPVNLVPEMPDLTGTIADLLETIDPATIPVFAELDTTALNAEIEAALERVSKTTMWVPVQLAPEPLTATPDILDSEVAALTEPRIEPETTEQEDMDSITEIVDRLVDSVLGKFRREGTTEEPDIEQLPVIEDVPVVPPQLTDTQALIDSVPDVSQPHVRQTDIDEGVAGTKGGGTAPIIAPNITIGPITVRNEGDIEQIKRAVMESLVRVINEESARKR